MLSVLCIHIRRPNANKVEHVRVTNKCRIDVVAVDAAANRRRVAVVILLSRRSEKKT